MVNRRIVVRVGSETTSNEPARRKRSERERERDEMNAQTRTQNSHNETMKKDDGEEGKDGKKKKTTFRVERKSSPSWISEVAIRGAAILSRAFRMNEWRYSEGSWVEVWLYDRKIVVSSKEKYDDLKRMFESIFCFTYRKNFSPIPTLTSRRITSDSGWGCMLRTCQMMLGTAFRRMYLGKRWCKADLGRDKHVVRRYVQILRWFADSPLSECFFSVHRMVEAGKRLGISPGEWFGPASVSQVSKVLLARHSAAGGPMIAYVASGGTLYTDEILNMVREIGLKATNDTSSPSQTQDEEEKEEDEEEEKDWTRAVMIFAPVRLGLDRFNQEFTPSLLQIMKLPQCLGFIGGSPHHSLYFVGSHGKRLFYLDPHTTYNTFDIRAATTTELKTYHCSRIRVMNVSNLDPSLAFGFLCRNSKDLFTLRMALSDINSESKSFPIISVAKKRRKPSVSFNSISLDSDSGGDSPPDVPSSSLNNQSSDEKKSKKKKENSGSDWTLL